MAIIEEQKIVETTVTLSISKKKTMARLAIIRVQIIIETTVRFSISRKDRNYG